MSTDEIRTLQDRGAAERERIRAAVFDHYGRVCTCCGITENLSIDHLNGDGKEHRAEIFGRPDGVGDMYRWLVRNGFPEGFQTLCRPCNTSKGKGSSCRLDHAAREAPADTLSLEPGFEIFLSPRLYWVDVEPWTLGSLAGLAEIASLAGVSRQRAGQLAAHPDFPKPVDRLAMGPVWREADVVKFIETPRSPGRKRKEDGKL